MFGWFIFLIDVFGLDLIRDKFETYSRWGLIERVSVVCQKTSFYMPLTRGKIPSALCH